MDQSNEEKFQENAEKVTMEMYKYMKKSYPENAIKSAQAMAIGTLAAKTFGREK